MTSIDVPLHGFGKLLRANPVLAELERREGLSGIEEKALRKSRERERSEVTERGRAPLEIGDLHRHHGIDATTLEADLEVEVRTGRAAGRTDLADALDLNHAISHDAHQQLLAGSTESLDVRRSIAAGNLAVANNDDDMGEYGNLVRYISNYKDGRRASTIGDDDDEVRKGPWWKFWAKKSGSGSSGDNFETPEEWLETNMQRGLTTAEVEQRRKKTGWNELTTEKENMFLKFLSYFTGPILYGQ